MKCKECGTDTAVREKSLALVKKYEVPFVCSLCGCLDFPYQATRDVVFVYPKKPKEKIGHILIPEKAQEEQEYAIILSVGKGYWNKKNTFIPTEIKAGDEVVYDKQVPWAHCILGSDGRQHLIKYMGYQDIKGVVSDF